MRRTTGLICLCTAALGSGCGGGGGARKPTHAARPSVCVAAARELVAHASGAPVAQRQSTGNNAQPQCTYRAGHVRVVANIDSSPQPYERLERAVVEAQQQFGAVRTEAPPERVAGLGLDADWFPREHQLMTTDGRKLITMTVAWPHARRARMRALARAVARVYLGRRAVPGG